MNIESKKVAILGSTGSIGRSALDVVRASDGRLEAVALSANRSTDLLFEQAAEFAPRWVVIADHDAAGDLSSAELPANSELLRGEDGLRHVASHDDVDIVLAAIVGAAGLGSTLAAAEAGKTVALANKEALVLGGGTLVRLAKKHGATLLPVDSEHSGVFQCLLAGNHDEIARILLTASGGPFRDKTLAALADVTVEDALAHPTWEMGRKITIDSATMMNKALEVIEARWLFDLSVDQIDVLIHPQSIVHAMVEFVDGSTMAQLGPPDMRLPIQYALEYPARRPCCAPALDWTQVPRLEFEIPDVARFDALALGYEAAKAGGTAGAAVNAANESAVSAFLRNRLPFAQIVQASRSVLEIHQYIADPTLDEILRVDRWARQEVEHWIHS